MEGDKNKPIFSDPEFDGLIPRPRGITETIKRNAGLEDTVQFLPKAIRRVVWQTEKIAPLVVGGTLEETCYNIWRRLYRAIRYQKDDEGKEQIRSPRCTWWGRRADCDDFSVFVSSVLCNLGIPHFFRIAMYSRINGFQHIYPVAIDPSGREIIIDCVLSKFNREVPYIEKKDTEMELQFLDGVEDEFSIHGMGNIDAEYLMEGDLGELGRRLRDMKIVKKVKESKVVKKVKEGLHKVNRVNPATALLRAGILACMKINMFNVAGMLRYTYLTDEQAKKKGMDMKKLSRLKGIREKLEKIFYGAGGKLENLKQAILTGKGNKNKDVPLSGFTGDSSDFSEDARLPELLGEAVYSSEMSGLNSLGELGVATEAAIAAATSTIAALAALIKQLGPLKPGGETATPSSEGSSNTAADASSIPSGDGSGSGSGTDKQTPADSSAPADSSTDTSKTPTDGGANSTTDTPATATDKDSAESSGDGKSSQRSSNTTTDTNKTSSTPDKQNDGFIKRATEWAKNNKPAAALIGIAVLAGLGYGGYKLATMGRKKQEPALSGAPKKRSKRESASGKGKLKIQRLK